MSFQSVKRVLKGMFAKPLSQLPTELRPIAESYIPIWDALTAIERRVKAQEIDQLRKAKFDDLVRKKQKQAEQDPRHLAEESTGWYDETLNADILWKMPDVEPKAAATILCGHNPLDLGTSPDATTTEEGQATPEDYRRLFTFLSSVRATNNKPRTLLQWRDIAREHGLKYHSWIDEYALAIPNNYGGEAPPDPIAGDSVSATESPAERRAKLDITGERGCRRRILENWKTIESGYGPKADGRQVLHFLKQAKDEKQPVLKTVQNHLAKLRQEKLIP
jgi:hypothetical protein